MPLRTSAIRLSALASLSAALLLPVPGMAQIGITGSALGPTPTEIAARNSQFDTGFKSKSALGQLEELTGSKVDRSSQASGRNAVAPAARKVKAAPPRLSVGQTMALGIIESVLTDILFDNPAKKRAEEEAAAKAAAEAAEAAAAAEAEARRLAEVARLTRLRIAGILRASWDVSDVMTSSTLAGAFDVKVKQGTSFFGSPAGPDPDAVAAILASGPAATAQTTVTIPGVPSVDASVVDLRGIDKPTVGLFTPPAKPVRGLGNGYVRIDFAPPYVSPKASPSDNFGHELGERLGEWYDEALKGVVKETLWGLASNLPGQKKLKAFWEFKENYDSIGNPLKMYAQNILGLAFDRANTLTNPNSRSDPSGYAYDRSLQQLGGEMQLKSYEMAYDSFRGRVTPSSDLNELRHVEIEESSVTPLLGIKKGLHGFIRITH